jgi:hypothetical protein
MGKTCTIFDSALAKDAEIMIGQEVKVLVEPSKRKPGKWVYLAFKELREEQPAEVKEELPW